MFNHPYICLSTKPDLSDESVMNWLKATVDSGPPGIIAATELRANNKPQQFYRRKINGLNRYCIVLARDLEADEANAIAHTANSNIPNDDFEITWSQRPQNDIRNEIVQDDIVKIIALEAAKRSHTVWLNRKLTEGWRFSNNFNSRNKTSPMCREWDALSDRYKRAEYHRMTTLLEILDEMKLSLARKRL